MSEPPWGPETAKAIANFPISGQPLPWELIAALVEIKRAAAIVNARKRVIPKRIADAIVAAADGLLAEPRPDWFPVDVFQTGSGTSTNMNVNEVLATLASDRGGLVVHPNDHVNASQSSNDVFPSAISVAAHRGIGRAGAALVHLADSLDERARAYGSAVKAARTHLQDAAPMTFGQELEAWSAQVRDGSQRLLFQRGGLSALAIGGSAVGTGLNTPRGFGSAVAALLDADGGAPFHEAANHGAAQYGIGPLVRASGVARVAGLEMFKLAGDLRLLSSGPNTGLAELTLPELQKGSSAMPGKVNPVIPEAVQQVCCQIVGNDAAVTFASTLSTLQLNTAMPVVARNLLESLRLLEAAARVLADKCVSGLVADTDRMRRYAEHSPAVVTALVPLVGYDRAGEIAREAQASGRTVAEVVAADPTLGPDVAATLDPLRMARPHRRP